MSRVVELDEADEASSSAGLRPGADAGAGLRAVAVDEILILLVAGRELIAVAVVVVVVAALVVPLALAAVSADLLGTGVVLTGSMAGMLVWAAMISGAHGRPPSSPPAEVFRDTCWEREDTVWRSVGTL